MGKGKAEKSAFHRFIDDSYFAFWFRQWGAFFLVVGVILIIVGIVVSQVYPKSKETGFAEGQLVTSAASPEYDTWARKVETVSYEFLDVNPANLTCSLRGPFVFDVTTEKTAVTFFGDGSVSYKLSKSKTFRAGESSSNLTPVRTINPSYLHLAKVNGSGQEVPFLLDGYRRSTIDADLETFFRSTVPDLIAARGVAQLFPASIAKVREDNLYPAYFGALNKSITDYEMVYLIDKASKRTCPHCPTPSAANQGVLGNVFGSWNENPNCRIDPTAGKTLDEFKGLLITGFAAIPAGPCKDFLSAHSFNGSIWAGAEEVAYSILNSMSSLTTNLLQDWYNPSDPFTSGFCNDRAAAVTQFPSSTLDQINDVCDRFLKLFFDEAANGVPRAEIGPRHFCVGPAAADPSLIIPSLPTDFTFSRVPLASMTSGAFNLATCLRFISVLGDVDNFVKPAYQSASIPPSYTTTLSAQEYSTLRAYLLSHDNDFKRWFVSVWRGPAGPYNCASCFIRPFGELSNKDAFDASSFEKLALMVFPELSPTALRLELALTNPDPKPKLIDPTLFSNITQATGILSVMLRLDTALFKAQFLGLSDAQASAIETYAITQADRYLQKVRTDNGLGSSKAAVGLLQFARAQLACGPNNPTGRCSVGEEFFGLQTPYAPEFGIASYNPSPSPVYYRSFVQADSTLRDTATHLDMSDLFTFLADKSNENLVLNANVEESFRKYFFYLLATFVRDEFVPTTSGAIASRPPTEWINGAEDQAVLTFGSIPSFFGFEPNGAGSTLKINSGSSDISLAYNLLQIDGSATITAYPTPIDVTTLKNPDAFAPGAVSVGENVPVLDIDLERPFTFTFGADNVEVLGVSTKKGVVSSSDWAVNPAYGITTASLMPIPYAPITRFYSPCSASFTHTCKFPALADDEEDLFPKDFAIYSDLKTGLVVRRESCVIMSVKVDGDEAFDPFPITGKGIAANTVFSQVRRRSFTEIPAPKADSYLEQFTSVKNTSTAILLALVIVGALFVAVGIVFFVFYFVRQSRKSHAKSELDLVEDPFGEKNKNVASMKY